MATQPIEKRSFIRVPFNTEVEVRARGRSIRSREGVNISMSGVRLDTCESIPPLGVRCEVSINLGNPDAPVIIHANGKTIWSQAGRMAVEFIELDIESYQHLRQLIVNNAGDPKRAEEEFSAHWGIRMPDR